jgi:hypothetical protein
LQLIYDIKIIKLLNSNSQLKTTPFSNLKLLNTIMSKTENDESIGPEFGQKCQQHFTVTVGSSIMNITHTLK